MARTHAGLLLLLALLTVAHDARPAALQRPAAPVSSRDEREEGERLLRRGDYIQALARLRRANDLAGGTCGDCLIGMAQAMLGMKAYANVLETAVLAINAVPEQRPIVAKAHLLRAEVFQAQAETDPAKYRDVEAEFRLAAQFDPENEDAHYGLGVTLLKLNRDDEAIAALKRFLEIRDIGPSADAVRAMIDNPRRGRERFAPEYSFVAVDGTRLSTEAMRGKVVLFDFWSTECPLCVAAVPALRDLQKKYVAAPLVIVGVSADRDDYAWRRFTVDQRMVWPQFWDRRRDVASTFGVIGYPTYVLIDGEGIEQMRVIGEGFHRSAKLRAAVDAQIARLTARP